MGEVVFCAISISHRIAVDEDGNRHTIIDVFDSDGHAAATDAEAVTLVVQMNDGMFAVIDMTEFVDAPLN